MNENRPPFFYDYSNVVTTSTNPSTVKIKHIREIIKKAYTNGLSFCANGSVLPCEISGSGYFYGAGGKKSVAFFLHRGAWRCIVI